MAKRTQGMDGMRALGLKAQPAALGFAIDGDALAAAGAQFAGQRRDRSRRARRAAKAPRDRGGGTGAAGSIGSGVRAVGKPSAR